MEVPASLVRRNLSGVEIRLANIVYGCADIRDAVPKCTLPKSRVIALLGCSSRTFDRVSKAIADLGYWRRVNLPEGSSYWRWEILVKPAQGFQYGTDMDGGPGPKRMSVGSVIPTDMDDGPPPTRATVVDRHAWRPPTDMDGGTRTGNEQEVGQQEEQQQLAAAGVDLALSMLNAQRALLGGGPIDGDRERAAVRKAIGRAASEGAADRIGCDPATLVGCGLMAGAARHMNGPRDSADAKAGKRATPSALCRSWDDFVAGAAEHFAAHGTRPEPKREPKAKRSRGAASHGPRR
jgi:hypothetical protein